VTLTVFNIFTGDLDVPPDPSDPLGYACSARRVGAAIGAERIGMSIYELPTGQARYGRATLFAFHRARPVRT
jgi:hypothetical protein